MTDDKRKSVRFVLIYGLALFVIAGVLVGISLFIHVLNTNRLQSEIDNTQQGYVNTQNTLKNVQEENAALLLLIDDANSRAAETEKENAALTEQNEQLQKHIDSLAAMATASRYIIDGQFSLARESLSLADTTLLTEAETEAYNRMYSRLY